MTEPVDEEISKILFQRYKSDEGSTQHLDIIKEHRKSLRPSTPIQIDDLEKKWLFSSAQCDLAELKRLVESDFKLINQRDFATGFAAIHWAAKKGRVDIVTWLNEHNADVNIRTHGGYSPLHIATMHNRTSLINKLISDFNADTNVRDYSGRKPKHYGRSPVTPISTHVDPFKHLAAVRSDVAFLRYSMPNSNSMPSIADQVGTKKKKKGILLSNSFKGKRKLLVMKRDNSEPNGSDESSPPVRQKGRWRKSLSVPDIAISGPYIKFEQDI